MYTAYYNNIVAKLLFTLLKDVIIKFIVIYAYKITFIMCIVQVLISLRQLTKIYVVTYTFI